MAGFTSSGPKQGSYLESGSLCRWITHKLTPDFKFQRAANKNVTTR